MYYCIPLHWVGHIRLCLLKVHMDVLHMRPCTLKVHECWTLGSDGVWERGALNLPRHPPSHLLHIPSALIEATLHVAARDAAPGMRPQQAKGDGLSHMQRWHSSHIWHCTEHRATASIWRFPDYVDTRCLAEALSVAPQGWQRSRRGGCTRPHAPPSVPTSSSPTRWRSRCGPPAATPCSASRCCTTSAARRGACACCSSWRGCCGRAGGRW
jgi:hypothetical protein